MKAGSSAQAGALVSKGLSALGNTFRVGSFTNQNPQTNYMNFVSVMATEDNTIVTFDDLPIGLTIKNYTGAFPVTINLNKSESYTLATNSSENTINRDGLIGALVKSDKPIVVNSGSANGSFDGGGGRDYGIDQIVDYSKVGNEYIFVKGDGNDGWENVLIVAHEDNTTVSINGNPPITTIDSGEYYLIEGTNYSVNQNMYVATNKNVFAYQGIGANSSEANQGLFFVPPLSCENRGNVNNIASIQNIGSTSYNGGVTIITNKNATVTVNSQPINALPQDVTGNSNYVTYKLSGLLGDVSIESTGELYCAYYNFNGAATSGSFYSGFPSAPEINLNTTVQTLGTCIPNITLSATNIDIFDSFEWFFNDGSGFVTTGVTSNNYVPTQPGNYKLIGVINCSGLQFESIEISASSTDPVKARDIVQEIIDQLNIVILETQKEKYKEIILINSKMVNEKRVELDSLQNLIHDISTKYGLLDYIAQSEEVTEGYLKFLIAGKKGKDFEEAKALYKNLEEHGRHFHNLHAQLNMVNVEYMERKTNYEHSLKDYNKVQTYSNVIVSPEVPDKKSYPIRWLIVVLAAASSVFFAFIILLIFGYHKK